MKEKIINIPNTISLLRIPLTILIIFNLDSNIKYLYLGVLIISDLLDGMIARKLNQTTKFGEVLDPVVDKFFAITVFISVSLTLKLPLFYFGMFFLRDAFSILAVIFLLTQHKKIKGVEIKARPFGKLTTALQFLTIVAMVWGQLDVIFFGVILVFISSIFTIIDYLTYYKTQTK